MIVLIRVPMPVSAATARASMTQKSIFLSTSWRWTSMGRRSQISSGPYGEFRRNVAPGFAKSRILILSSSPNWWQATKFAASMR